ncbi:hypothetical protein F5Y12DRAFT_761397 [Xylaria sp. FL1777]|nr:hypothetical protein F5Y12DRAFT_761397 [Xylaria sp. FL1777]
MLAVSDLVLGVIVRILQQCATLDDLPMITLGLAQVSTLPHYGVSASRQPRLQKGKQRPIPYHRPESNVSIFLLAYWLLDTILAAGMG